METIKTSYCEAFESDEQLNAVIKKYVDLRKKDRFDAIDYIDTFRKKMNTEGKNDLQEVLDRVFDEQ
jgi:hypothetical protein